MCEDSITMEEKTYLDASTIWNIMRGTSYAYWLPEKFVVYDQAEYEDALHYLEFNSQGIVFGKRENTSQNFTPSSVWTIDGTFDAKDITVKNLKADSIIDGTLTLGNQSDGELLLKDDTGITQMEISTQRFQIRLNSGGWIYIGKDIGLQILNSSYQTMFGNELVWTAATGNFQNNINYYSTSGNLNSLIPEKDIDDTASAVGKYTVQSKDSFKVGSTFNFGPIQTLTIDSTNHKGLGFIKGGN